MEKQLVVTARLKFATLTLDKIQYDYPGRKTQHHINCTCKNLEQSEITTVPDSVLGYWVDMIDYQGEIIYRQFLNNKIPLNIAYVCQQWSGLKKRRAIFDIYLPNLSAGREIILYEQSRTHQHHQLPTRKQHFKACLNQYLDHIA